MKRNEKAVAVMLVAVAAGVVAQRVAKQEAVILGLTPIELA